MTTFNITTTIRLAKVRIPFFCERYEFMEQRMSLLDLSNNTFKNYSRNLAKISLVFGQLPEFCTDKQIDDYLLDLLKKKPASESGFKHMMYGLRFYFKMLGA